MPEPVPSTAEWQVYILLCSDGSLYTGISTDVERRFGRHADGRGARYFRGREPVQIVYREGGHDRASASRREAEIKRLPRQAKLDLIAATAQPEPPCPTPTT